MLRFRFLGVFAATCLALGALRALGHEDTPAQAAARAALEQQMNQMDNGQSVGSTNSVTPPPAAPAEPASQLPPAAASSQPPPAAPITTPTPQFSTNVPVNAEVESATAPAGMSQTNEPATAQMQTQTNVASMTVPPSVLNTNETEQYPVNPPMAPLPPPQAEAPSTPQSAAMQQTHPVAVPTSEPGNQWPAAAQSNPSAQQLPPSAEMNGAAPAMNGTGPNMTGDRQTTNGVSAYSPITAPPLPISQEQQAELQNLLSQYMANQITPTQYQEQRAKILAGQ